MHVNARPVARKHADVRDGVGFWVTGAEGQLHQVLVFRGWDLCVRQFCRTLSSAPTCLAIEHAYACRSGVGRLDVAPGAVLPGVAQHLPTGHLLALMRQPTGHLLALIRISCKRLYELPRPSPD